MELRSSAKRSESGIQTRSHVLSPTTPPSHQNRQMHRKSRQARASSSTSMHTPDRKSRSLSYFPLLDLQDDLLLEVINLLPCAEKKALRQTCRRLKHATSLTVTHLAVTKAMHQDLPSSRRTALCLSLSSRLPALTSLAVDTCPPALLPRILTQLTSLTELETGEAPITSSIASSLSSLPHLLSLTIVSTPPLLLSLPPSPSLAHLHIFLAYKTNRVRSQQIPLHVLLNYPSLSSLALHHLLGTQIPPDFLHPLSSLPSLRSLHYCCNHCHLTPSPGLILSHLTHLTYLSIPAFGSLTLSTLPSLTNLRELSLNGWCPPNDVTLWSSQPLHFPALTSLSVCCGLLVPPSKVVAPLLQVLNIHEMMEEMQVEVSTALWQVLPLPQLHTLHLSTPTLALSETCSLLALVAQQLPQLLDLTLDATFSTQAVQALSKLTSLTQLQLSAQQTSLHILTQLQTLKSLPRMKHFSLHYF